MKRKAIVNQTTVGLVLLVLVLFMLLGILRVTVLSAGEGTERLSCRISAVISAYANDGVAGIINPFELYCPRQVIVVDDNKMSKQLQHIVPQLQGKTRPYAFSSMLGIEDESTPKTYDKIEWNGEQTANQLEALIGYEMAECWNTFNEGVDKVIRGSRVWDHDTCFICSEIIFTGAGDQAVSLNMQEHLATTNNHGSGQRQFSLQDYLYTSRDFPNSRLCNNEFRKAYHGDENAENPPPIPLTVQEGSGVLVMLYKHEITGFDESCLSVQYVDSREFPSMCRILIN